jgi:repressor LexA
MEVIDLLYKPELPCVIQVKRDEKDLNKRLNKIYDFYQKEGRMPTYSEIAEMFGWRSKNSVHKFILKLQKLDLIKKDKKGRILLPSSGRLKVLGAIEAGFPSPAEEELCDTLSLDKWLIENPSSTFLLKVSGDSMYEAGILPGDLVLVDKAHTPKNGDIVIAEVDGQWTMKYLKKRGNEVILLPANSKYKPIKPKSELKIGGVVTAVIRKYK